MVILAPSAAWSGAKHFVQERRRNSSGSGLVRQLFLRQQRPGGTLHGDADRIARQCCPGFRGQPKVVLASRMRGSARWYEEATGTLATGIGTLYAGRGYPTGASHPAPSGFYQWQRNSGGWTNIAGATTAKYDL